MIFETFGARLKRLRLERRLSYREFALRIDSCASVIALYQNGSRHPGFWLLCEMAKVLDVSLDYLMLGREYEEGLYRVAAARAAARAAADSERRHVV